MRPLLWVVTSAVSGYAAHLAVTHGTPVDAQLPLIAILATVVAAVSYPSLMIAVPLLIAVEITIADEGTRLLLLGVIAAAVWCAGILKASQREANQKPETRNQKEGSSGFWFLVSGFYPPGPPLVLTASSILLLRWIPLHDLLVMREIVLLAIALAIVVAMGRTPFAVVIGILAALLTPAVPLRTFALPLLVLGAALVARFASAPRVRLAWPSAIVLGLVMLFFAWSGVVARGFRWFLSPPLPHQPEMIVAIPPGESLTFDVPETARSLVVSGANVSHFRRGRLIGVIEPGGIELRIGEVADWGFMRREHYHHSRNPLPDRPAGRLSGYGYTSWVDGAARVSLPAGSRTILVKAAADLPAGASLQVQGFDSSGR